MIEETKEILLSKTFLAPVIIACGKILVLLLVIFSGIREKSVSIKFVEF